MALTTRLSTRSQPADGRLDYWNERVSGIFPGIVIDGERDLAAEWETCRLGDIVVSVARSDRATIRRWNGPRPPAATDRGKIHLQHSGFSTTVQRGRSAALVAGDLTYCAVDEPYELQVSERNEMFVIDFPLSAFRERATAPALVVDHRAPSAGLLRDFLGSIFRQHWPETIDPEETDALGVTVGHLIGRCFGHVEAPEAAEWSNARRRVLAYVDANLADSSMRTGQIARALSLPPRAVQGVFADLATTPTAYIIDRRLSIAAQRLKESPSTQSMTDLAYELGFADAAHFSRRFKARFGVPPGTFSRRRADG